MKKSRLRAARKQAGLTLDEMHKRTGVPISTIHEIEQMRHTPAVDRAATLYYELGLDLEDALADFGIEIERTVRAKQTA
jgi:transcriptional regulator with XRE-family HTH domain